MNEILELVKILTITLAGGVSLILFIVFVVYPWIYDKQREKQEKELTELDRMALSVIVPEHLADLNIDRGITLANLDVDWVVDQVIQGQLGRKMRLASEKNHWQTRFVEEFDIVAQRGALLAFTFRKYCGQNRHQEIYVSLHIIEMIIDPFQRILTTKVRYTGSADILQKRSNTQEKTIFDELRICA